MRPANETVDPMIDVYSWTTGNARKVYIMLEECGLAFRVHPVNITKGDQFKSDFLKISPNNKIPAIIDQDGPNGTPYSLFETGAILMYLANRTSRFLPTDAVARYQTIQWLMWQMGDFGPMFGQAGHYINKAKDSALAQARDHFVSDAARLMRVLDKRCGESEYVAGSEYTIADIAIYPWCQEPVKRGLNHDDYPQFKRWFNQVGARAAVQKADLLCDEIRAEKITTHIKSASLGEN